MPKKLHILKILKKHYQDVIDGRKLFEVRYNDRDFKVNEILFLAEVDEDNNCQLTGRNSTYDITYVLDSEDFVKPGFVVMGIKPRQ